MLLKEFFDCFLFLLLQSLKFLLALIHDFSDSEFLPSNLLLLYILLFYFFIVPEFLSSWLIPIAALSLHHEIVIGFKDFADFALVI